MTDRFSMARRRALITGASMSIGRSLALAFADHGAAVAVHHSAEADARAGLHDAGRETLAEVRRRGAGGCLVEGDLAAAGSGRRIVDEAIAALGGVDVLVVCASVQTRAPFLEVTAEAIERQVAIDFRATIELLQAALPPMRERGWGRVLTIGSINQARPSPDLAVYAALKAAQLNLAVNLAREYAPHGVMINNLAPGLVATERNRWMRDDEYAWRTFEASAAAPFGRAATPDEMTGAALLLCSEAASYIAGVDLMVTAGAHLPASGRPPRA